VLRIINGCENRSAPRQQRSSGFSRQTCRALFWRGSDTRVNHSGDCHTSLWRLSYLTCLPALFRVLQNDTAPMLIDNRPFFDLLQRSKTAEAGKVVVQTAIADARGLSGDFDFTHCRTARSEASDLITQVNVNPRNPSHKAGCRILRATPQRPAVGLSSRRHLYNSASLHHEGYVLDRGDIV